MNEVRYYVHFRVAGWHEIATFGDHLHMRTKCGRTIHVGQDGEGVERVCSDHTKHQYIPEGALCSECEHPPVQLSLFGQEEVTKREQ